MRRSGCRDRATLRFGLVAMLAIAAPASGCDGSDATSADEGDAKTSASEGGAGATLGDADLQEAVTAFATADCNSLARCMPGYMHTYLGSSENCVARSLLLNTWRARILGSSWTAEVWTALAASYQNRSCEEYWDFSPTPKPPTADRANGEPCNAASQCASDFCSNEAYECGTCEDGPEAGAPCAHGRCAWPLTCVSDACVEPGTEGDECSEDSPCRRDFSCYGGLCTTEPAEVGASCDSENGLHCDDDRGFLCFAHTNTCVPKTVYDEPGEICGTSIDDPSNLYSISCNRAYCSSEGECISFYVPDGSACSPDDGLYCEWPASCYAGFCQLPEDFELCGP